MIALISPRWFHARTQGTCRGLSLEAPILRELVTSAVHMKMRGMSGVGESSWTLLSMPGTSNS